MSADTRTLPDFSQMQRQLDRLNADAGAATSEPLPEPSGDEE